MKPGIRVRRRRRAAGKKAVGGTIASLRARDGGEPGSSGFLGWRKPAKRRVTLLLDADVLAWFKGSGPRYQREINWALRKVMAEERKKAGEGSR